MEGKRLKRENEIDYMEAELVLIWYGGGLPRSDHLEVPIATGLAIDA